MIDYFEKTKVTGLEIIIEQKKLSLRFVKKETKTQVKSTMSFSTAFDYFSNQIKNIELFNHIQDKPSTVKFDLKSFSVSLACKALVFIKYLSRFQDPLIDSEIAKFLNRHLTGDGGTEESLS